MTAAVVVDADMQQAEVAAVRAEVWLLTVGTISFRCLAVMTALPVDTWCYLID